METNTEQNVQQRSLWRRGLSQLGQWALIAGCLFFAVVLTPIGQLMQTFPWWTALGPLQIGFVCLLLAVGGVVLMRILNRKSRT